MQKIELLRFQLNHLVAQARQDIFTLSTLDHNPSQKQQILQRLWDTISSIQFLSELLTTTQTLAPFYFASPQQPSMPIPSGYPSQQQMQIPSNMQPIPNQPTQQQNQRIFTLYELAKYDGKNGMPAYVAVNGIVYDVTNNRAWAAATHFALTAGKDYTNEFASCHAGQQSILATLPIVGRMM